MKRFWFLPVVLVLACVVLATARLEAGQEARGLQQLETGLRRTAVTCYAAEGRYPPSVDYMEQHYGLQYDRSRYVVQYEIFADNIMPDITVLEVAG